MLCLPPLHRCCCFGSSSRIAAACGMRAMRTQRTSSRQKQQARWKRRLTAGALHAHAARLDLNRHLIGDDEGPRRDELLHGGCRAGRRTGGGKRGGRQSAAGGRARCAGLPQPSRRCFCPASLSAPAARTARCCRAPARCCTLAAWHAAAPTLSTAPGWLHDAMLPAAPRPPGSPPRRCRCPRPPAQALTALSALTAASKRPLAAWGAPLGHPSMPKQAQHRMTPHAQGAAHRASFGAF